jgi:carbon storage regulator
MLVISREVNESLILNDNIIITILGVEGDKVKIGINAPREVVVLRQELWQAIHEQEQLAAQLASQEAPAQFEDLRKLLIDETQEDDEPPAPGEPQKPS